MLPYQRIAVKRLMLFMGVDQRGQLMGQSIIPNDTTKVFVIPGQMSIIETTTSQGKTITERPIGQFGWEYTIDDMEMENALPKVQQS